MMDKRLCRSESTIVLSYLGKIFTSFVGEVYWWFDFSISPEKGHQVAMEAFKIWWDLSQPMFLLNHMLVTTLFPSMGRHLKISELWLKFFPDWPTNKNYGPKYEQYVKTRILSSSSLKFLVFTCCLILGPIIFMSWLVWKNLSLSADTFKCRSIAGNKAVTNR